MGVIDVFATMAQAISLTIGCLMGIRKEQYDNLIKKSTICSIIIFLEGFSFTYILGNYSFLLYVVHILSLLTVYLIFHKNGINAILGYSFVYLIMSGMTILGDILLLVSSYLSGNVVNGDFFTVLIMIFEVILMILIILKRDFMQQLYDIVNSHERRKIIMFVLSMMIDYIFIVLLNQFQIRTVKSVFGSITLILSGLLLIGLATYIARIKEQSDNILQINKPLQEKNKELRKIKHDFGAQISYLYGLYLMKRYDELGQALKDIINNNKSVQSAVEINHNDNVILSLAIQPALDAGIHVIVKDQGGLNHIGMPEMELYRIMINIINNAVRAMNGEGIITVCVYESIKNVVIEIENNGPRIPSANIEKIFNAGFTTKDDEDKNHGFGLSIVKELIESYGGRISVNSTNEVTCFKITLPIVKDKKLI